MKEFYILFSLKIAMLVFALGMTIIFSMSKEWGSVCGFGGIVIGMAIFIIEDIKRIKNRSI